MTELICLGGPWHGRFVDPGPHEYVRAPMPVRPVVFSDAAEPDSLPLGHVVTYRRSRVMILGWRFPLDCLTNWPVGQGVPDGIVLPGYVHGVPFECEPAHDPPPMTCRCPRIDVDRVLGHITEGLPLIVHSACYLDHCPLHGPFRER
jgi:hypothetical protein